MKRETLKKHKTGRPLSFDRAAALREAMLVFWRHGYETSSIVDLTTAMKITAPSLYTAFGDKQQLFLEAVALYAGDPAERARAIQTAPSAYAAASGLLEAVAVTFTGEETPAGCLLASATATGSAAATSVRRAVADIRRGLSEELTARIAQDVAEARLPGGTDATVLADLVVAVIQGMSVLARDGASRQQLLAIARLAMKAWPILDRD